MTPHDQISAYIDNELGAEQEQDFLISLASSDGLRKSFRSELVLKNVIHQDEVLTTPSRDMRGAVLTTLGIAGVSALASETADAAAIVSGAKATFVKTMFASKLNALVTASMVTASALGGYAVHTIIAEKPATHMVTAPVIRNTQPAITAPAQVASPVMNTATDMSHESAPKMTAAKHKSVPKVTEPSKTETTTGTTPGIGAANVNPIIETPKK
jgi:negative regulator of sigma E activity